jgi:uncharacterized protein YkwD
MVRSLLRGVLVFALAASACGGESPSAPSQDSSSSAAQTAARVLSLSGSLTFGSVEVGRTAESALTITNSGTAALSVTGITVPEGFTLSWSSGTVAAGGSQQATVRFAPTAVRSYSGTLTVNGDQTAGANTLTVAGSGVPTALAAIAGTASELGAGPLGGVNIEIRDGPDATKTTTTDAEGRFSLPGLQPGSVTVRAWKTGYTETDLRASLAAGNVVALTFAIPKASSSSGTTPTTPEPPATPAPPSTPTPAPTTPTPAPTPTPTPTPAPAPTPAPTTPAPAPSSAPSAYDDEILRLVNDHRRSIGKPALEKVTVIFQQANGHSVNMAAGTIPFGHDGFEGRIAAIRSALGGSSSGGENVAMGFNSASAVVNAWLGSAGHRANIESSATRTGISAVQSKLGVWYYTQIFY